MKEFLNKIIEGDTLKILKTIPDNYVDLGISSPPYNKGEKQKGWLVKNVEYANASDKLPEAEYQANQIKVLNQLFRIIKPGGSFFYNHKTRWDRGNMLHPISWLCQTKWAIRQEIIWDRAIAANIRGWRFWQIEERIYWLYKPINGNKIGKELASKHALLTSIWRFKPERNNPHPAPFPIELPTRIIASILDEAQGIVIDPYAGSGTSLVASKLLNKDFIGIEIAKKYIALAEERLNNAERERGKIQEELLKHKVQKTFKERKAKNEFTGRYKNSVSNPVNDVNSVSVNNQSSLF